jgi:hypothetical protein
MKRQDNQFAILFGVEDDDYLLNFTADPLDYEDGTCWIECRIRSADKDKLLVVTGWSLERRSSDGAWLINGLDWQDFREKYRPGIGREEWERYVSFPFLEAFFLDLRCSHHRFILFLEYFLEFVVNLRVSPQALSWRPYFSIII